MTGTSPQAAAAPDTAPLPVPSPDAAPAAPPATAAPSASAGPSATAASAGPAAPARRSRRPRFLRGWRLALTTVVVLIALFVAATLRLFVYPPADGPAKADAIVMFDGVGDRHGAAISLARQGYAPVLAISTRDPDWCHRTTVPGVRVLCFVPEPANTRGEAEATADMVRRYHWRQTIVVVGRPQDTRARLLLDRCHADNARIATVAPGSQWASTLAYEWGALLKALVLKRSC